MNKNSLYVGGFSALLLAVLFAVPDTLLTMLDKQVIAIVVGFFVALLCIISVLTEVLE